MAKSKGQKLLLEVNASHREVASLVQSTKQTVSCWRNGSKKPGKKNRASLHQAFGIEPHLWDCKPGDDHEDSSVSTANGHAKVKGEGDPANQQVWMPVTQLLEELTRPGVSESDRIRLVRALKNRLDEPKSEAEIVMNHPAWMRVRVAIWKALKPYPEATKAVAGALSDLE